MDNYSDIIDNRKMFLKDRINAFLKASDEAKFAVGYFFLSGFDEIAKNIANLKEIKLIIGTTSNAKTIEEIAEGISKKEEIEEILNRQKYQKPSERKAILEVSKEKIANNIGHLDQSEENEGMLLRLRNLIANEKVKIKLYTRHKLHSKAYLFKYKREIAEQQGAKGIGIVGSSNLTLAGFQHSTELNVIVRGNENYKGRENWFDEIWNESTDFKGEFLNAIDNSWALKTVNPYDIYIMTLYYLVQSRMKYRSQVLWDWSNIPKLYRFQRIAVMQAYEILNKYNGVFVSDVVGFGKTFIGSALLKQIGKRTVVICPPRLKRMWEEFGEKFKVDIKTISQGALNKGVFNEDSVLWTYRDRQIILIDESDNFRNSDNKRYREIQPFLSDKKVILITATPQNTSIWNIYNQIRLFNQEGINEYQVKGGSLKEFFNMVDKKEAKIQDLLRNILIRRTRNHIRKFYNTVEDIPIQFPKRKLTTISYSIDETYNNLYGKIKSALMNLTYARYNLWPYVKEEKREDTIYKDLRKITGLLKGLHKVMLFKRLESSIFAFSKTINRLLKIHKRFLESIDRGIIPAGEEAQDILYQEDILIEDAFERLKEASKKYKVEDFKVKLLREALKSDIGNLEEISEYLKEIPQKSDKKFDELIKILGKHKEDKILVFSEYADTVKYLYKRLKDRFDNLTFVTAKSKEAISIIRRFAPVANGYELRETETPINILCSTDVFSRGLNLQDCSIVINYDLHWNPVRLIQRVGRIDRIGSQNEEIFAYNFLPHQRVEEEISLRERVHNRAQEIHDHIGEDEKILDESERLNEEDMYTIYDKRNIEQLEEKMEEDEGFSLDEAEMIIESLNREKSEYMNLIKSFQLGTKSCKKGQNYKGLFACFRKGEIIEPLIFDREREIILSPGKVLAEIKCEPSENTERISQEDRRFFFNNLRKMQDYFEKEVRQRTKKERKKEPVIIKTTKKLTQLRREIKDQDILDLLDKINDTLNKGVPEEVLRELKRLNREKTEGIDFLKYLVEIYNKFKLGERKEKQDLRKKYELTELICCEILK